MVKWLRVLSPIAKDSNFEGHNGKVDSGEDVNMEIKGHGVVGWLLDDTLPAWDMDVE